MTSFHIGDRISSMIKILSRKRLKKLLEEFPNIYTAIIICEPNKLHLVEDYFVYCKEYIYVEFDDIEFEGYYGPKLEQIEDILNWVKERLSADLIVSCAAGISRSSAIGYLVEYLRDSEKAIEVLDPNIHWPNKLIIRHSSKILGEEVLEPINRYYELIR